MCVTDVRNRRLGTQKRENRDGDERIYTYIYIYIHREGRIRGWKKQEEEEGRERDML